MNIMSGRQCGRSHLISEHIKQLPDDVGVLNLEELKKSYNLLSSKYISVEKYLHKLNAIHGFNYPHNELRNI